MIREKVISKIKKLLELSNSSNEHEAAQAAALAAELQLKHQIDEASITDDTSDEVNEPITDEVLDKMGRALHWKLNLANGLCKAFGCRVYFRRASAGRRGVNQKRSSTFRVIGQSSNIEAIRYMYQYLINEVVRLTDKAYGEEVSECKKSLVSPPSARTWKRAFRLGVATIIYKRLVEQREQTLSEAKKDGKSNALMVLDKQSSAVEEYVKKNLNLKYGSVPTFTSRSGYAAGIDAGKNISLSNNGKLGAGKKHLKG